MMAPQQNTPRISSQGAQGQAGGGSSQTLPALYPRAWAMRTPPRIIL